MSHPRDEAGDLPSWLVVSCGTCSRYVSSRRFFWHTPQRILMVTERRYFSLPTLRAKNSRTWARRAFSFEKVAFTKLLLDTCISAHADRTLRSLGYDVEWVAKWKSDPGDNEILKAAHDAQRILVTLDKDFGELGRHRWLNFNSYPTFFLSHWPTFSR